MTQVNDRQMVRATCCATWTHPLARLLLGEHLHPGAERATTEAVGGLRLPQGSRVLDVGCGPGAGLRCIAGSGLQAAGLDLSWEAASEASAVAPVVVGDAEVLPFSDGAFDGVIAQCVLSLLFDKGGAVRELLRIVRRGGRIAVSDVTVDGELPSPLRDMGTWSTCVGGALSTRQYSDLLADAGFEKIYCGRRDADLLLLLGQIRRRLALGETALVASGLDVASLGVQPGSLERGRRLMNTAIETVREGKLGYALWLAGRG